MKHLLLRRIAAVAAVLVCGVGVSGASPSSSNDPTEATQLI